MYRRIFIILLMAVAISPLFAHDIHVSVIELEQKENGEWHFSVRIFLDDLMNACGLTPGEELPAAYSSSDEIIEQYLHEHFSVSIGGVTQDLSYEESVADQMSVWIDLTLQVDEHRAGEVVKVKNTILLDLFDDQLNLLHLRQGDTRRSFTFDQQDQELVVR